jgi:nucleotide-binding universal stress UspA family protein
MVIIAAVDQSDRAPLVIEEAESLARAFEDEVHVVHVVKRSEFLNSNSGFPNAQSNRQVDIDRIREAAAEQVEQVSSRLDVKYRTVGLVGDPTDKIIAYAEDQDTRYIVVSPRKRSRAGKAIFGSTAQSILLNTTDPVVTAIRE